MAAADHVKLQRGRTRESAEMSASRRSTSQARQLQRGRTRESAEILCLPLIGETSSGSFNGAALVRVRRYSWLGLPWSVMA